jgi:hypothetical protein
MQNIRWYWAEYAFAENIICYQAHVAGGMSMVQTFEAVIC